MLDADELLLLLWEDEDDSATGADVEVGAEPSAWWLVMTSPWWTRYWAWPLYKTPAESLYVGLDVSQLIGTATVTGATVSYTVGHGLTVDSSATVLADDLSLGIHVAGGRRNTRHVLMVVIDTSDSQRIKIECPVQVTW